MVVLSVPAPLLGDGDPELHRAARPGGHLRGHVCGGLHPRQPVADGPDGGGRLRRRRRDRRDREHRPVPGAGRCALRGGPEGGPPDRLHGGVDDACPRGRLHPPDFHDRAARAAAARIRAHPDLGHRDVGHRVAHLHADDVQQVPAARKGRRTPSPTGSSPAWRTGFNAMLGVYDRGLRWVLRARED